MTARIPLTYCLIVLCFGRNPAQAADVIGPREPDQGTTAATEHITKNGGDGYCYDTKCAGSGKYENFTRYCDHRDNSKYRAEMFQDLLQMTAD